MDMMEFRRMWRRSLQFGVCLGGHGTPHLAIEFGVDLCEFRCEKGENEGTEIWFFFFFSEPDRQDCPSSESGIECRLPSNAADSSSSHFTFWFAVSSFDETSEWIDEYGSSESPVSDEPFSKVAESSQQ
jgi:hypothetical protein